KPGHTDKAGAGRIFYCEYEEYLKNWGFISDTFSKEAILKGSFDRYIEDKKRGKGTSEVDKEFLKLIEDWRARLARVLALRNKDISIYELNYAVQKIIDRIIFLRIAEDRQMEDYGMLSAISENENVFGNLTEIFRKADKKYNAGLFKQEKFLEHLNIDDHILKSIIKGLYYPTCPYEFSVLGVEILGNIYEQFLGKVIRLTPGHQAKVEEKPEVRKAGGVYYTPQYIVDYIVQNTVGELLGINEYGKNNNNVIASDQGERGNLSLTRQSKKTSESSKDNKTVIASGRRARGNLTPKQIESIHILDPACGSGSFLLGAYRYLLDYHLNYYTGDDKIREKSLKDGIIYQVSENTYRLTIAEKQKILLNNIYGVDIDRQAVEVTKLSLLLKLMEHENQESAGMLFKISDFKLLPDLSGNIKCGNSLIGSDFYKGQNLSLFEDDEKRKINAFDWAGPDGFPEIMKSGGFDIVIGNPPWVDIKGLDPGLVKYYFKAFKTTSNRINLYAIFIERSLNILKFKGFFGYIIPNSILMQSSYSKIRELILNEFRILNIVKLPDNVFENVNAETCIITINKFEDKKQKTRLFIYKREDSINYISKSNCEKYKNVNQVIWKDFSFNTFNIFIDNNLIDLLEKIDKNEVKLYDICDFTLGITPYDKYQGHSQEQIKNRVFHSTKKLNETYKKLISGGDINRYYVEWGGKEYISYGDWLAAPRREAFFTNPKIFVRQIISGIPGRIFAVYTEKEYYITQIGFSIISRGEVNLKYILGILNSKLMNFYHQFKYLDPLKYTFQKILIQNAKMFPIPLPDSKDFISNLVNLVDQMLEVQKKYHESKTDPDKNHYKKQIDIIDKQIDQLVYELYGLTEEEIKIVEENV
ncbi:MAG: N-6 DNA methylase, partial [bacterium]|nr:N-6 DNA methylase [bacterium]